MGADATIAMGIVIILLVVNVGGGIAAYYTYQYPVDKANGWINLASSSNDMNTVLYDLNQSLLLLAPFHGNPNLLFPNASTNFDIIKQQIESTVSTGIEVLNQTPSSFAYEQALKNIQSGLTDTIYSELQDAGSQNFTWHWGVYYWGLIPANVLALIAFFIFRT